jgi:hypothetical protein
MDTTSAFSYHPQTQKETKETKEAAKCSKCILKHRLHQIRASASRRTSVGSVKKMTMKKAHNDFSVK